MNDMAQKVVARFKTAFRPNTTQQKLLALVRKSPRGYAFHAGLMRAGHGRYTKLYKTNHRLREAALALQKLGVVDLKVIEKVDQEGELYSTYQVTKNPDHPFWAGRQAAEDDAYWDRLVKTHEREIQNIKKRLRQYHGGVFDEYAGLGAEAANKLRKALELHRVALGFAEGRKKPSKADLDEALRRLPVAVQRAKV